MSALSFVRNGFGFVRSSICKCCLSICFESCIIIVSDLVCDSVAASSWEWSSFSVELVSSDFN